MLEWEESTDTNTNTDTDSDSDSDSSEEQQWVLRGHLRRRTGFGPVGIRGMVDLADTTRIVHTSEGSALESRSELGASVRVGFDRGPALTASAAVSTSTRISSEQPLNRRRRSRRALVRESVNEVRRSRCLRGGIGLGPVGIGGMVGLADTTRIVHTSEGSALESRSELGASVRVGFDGGPALTASAAVSTSTHISSEQPLNRRRRSRRALVRESVNEVRRSRCLRGGIGLGPVGIGGMVGLADKTRIVHTSEGSALESRSELGASVRVGFDGGPALTASAAVSTSTRISSELPLYWRRRSRRVLVRESVNEVRHPLCLESRSELGASVRVGFDRGPALTASAAVSTSTRISSEQPLNRRRRSRRALVRESVNEVRRSRCLRGGIGLGPVGIGGMVGLADTTRIVHTSEGSALESRSELGASVRVGFDGGPALTASAAVSTSTHISSEQPLNRRRRSRRALVRESVNEVRRSRCLRGGIGLGPVGIGGMVGLADTTGIVRTSKGSALESRSELGAIVREGIDGGPAPTASAAVSNSTRISPERPLNRRRRRRSRRALLRESVNEVRRSRCLRGGIGLGPVGIGGMVGLADTTRIVHTSEGSALESRSMLGASVRAGIDGGPALTASAAVSTSTRIRSDGQSLDVDVNVGGNLGLDMGVTVR